MINMNARSLVNKTVELEHLLIVHNPHVVIVTETWLRPDINDREIIPPAYKMIRSDRDARGGGVAVIYKHKLQVVVINGCPGTESVLCKIMFGGTTYVIGAVYRPPNAPVGFLEAIQEYIFDSVPSNAHIIIGGDFNLPGICWSKLEAGSVDVKHCEILLDIAFNNDFTQIVNEITRIGTTSESLLDLVFVNSKIEEYEVAVHDGLSDHKIVLLCVKKVILPKHVKREVISVMSG